MTSCVFLQLFFKFRLYYKFPLILFYPQFVFGMPFLLLGCSIFDVGRLTFASILHYVTIRSAALDNPILRPGGYQDTFDISEGFNQGKAFFGS